ncbi:transmembrane protein, putative (macronuclear) [Tetrahymena thermophila SB210]|uniref:Transmembrane protein, putative n=1 Tax=Tetrahymena thermophila (strain SB210) TaxID=312017 RepID=W7WWF0_TETTS|nr:transmembrane protein, putative [Tetrahymena thermophila SB210]EWS71160.1 transmembrane protein, putative [Tetrahymena thermophila SB210]|eukprot:XP_012656301.1 transmembrane protein, putative [Tetrahymena thermophila SB210]
MNNKETIQIINNGFILYFSFIFYMIFLQNLIKKTIFQNKKLQIQKNILNAHKQNIILPNKCCYLISFYLIFIEIIYYKSKLNLQKQNLQIEIWQIKLRSGKFYY